ncbi:hypothetical protein BTVI_144566 [Pitangus sulphuratus]|nr:hypothetical protein BTVI_144566 [Pitangus sulphuratus]
MVFEDKVEMDYREWDIREPSREKGSLLECQIFGREFLQSPSAVKLGSKSVAAMSVVHAWKTLLKLPRGEARVE